MRLRRSLTVAALLAPPTLTARGLIPSSRRACRLAPIPTAAARRRSRRRVIEVLHILARDALAQLPLDAGQLAALLRRYQHQRVALVAGASRAADAVDVLFR